MRACPCIQTSSEPAASGALIRWFRLQRAGIRSAAASQGKTRGSEEGSEAVANGGAADGAVDEEGGAVPAGTEVPAGDEQRADLSNHAHLARAVMPPLLGPALQRPATARSASNGLQRR